MAAARAGSSIRISDALPDMPRISPKVRKEYENSVRKRRLGKLFGQA